MIDTNKKHCLVVTTFDKNQPGFLDFSYRIQSLAAHYQLTVLSTFAFTQPELQIPNVNYLVLDCKQGRMAWLGYLWNCAQLIKQQKPNVVVLLHSMAAPIAAITGDIPTVTYWNEHPTHIAPEPTGFAPIKALTRYAVRWLMYYGARKSTLVMPIGEAHRDDLFAHQCKPSQTQMIYMGVAQSFSGAALREKATLSNNPIRLVYVGSVQEDRGRDVMLEAIAIANKQSKIAYLTIVGASEAQYQYCHTALIKLGITDSVTIHGRVAGHMIPNFMQQADAGICLWQDLAWYRFNPPTKLFEYLVAGLPVLASNIRTHTQYVQDGFNGIIFNYDSKSLAQAIQKMWLRRDELPQMKSRTHQASAAYLWGNIEPVFLKVVEKAASE